MSLTVLSESKTEFGRESYDQNGENGKFGHSDRRVRFLGENDSRQCHCGIVAWQCGLVRVTCENGIVAWQSREVEQKSHYFVRE